MDAFTSVRFKAQQQREQLIAMCGCDNRAPDLLAAAMSAAGLRVMVVPPDYPLLGGGAGAFAKRIKGPSHGVRQGLGHAVRRTAPPTPTTVSRTDDRLGSWPARRLSLTRW